MIKITKKLVGDKSLQISSDLTMVSGGAWAVKMHLVHNAALLSSVAACEALYPRANVREFDPEIMHGTARRMPELIDYTLTKWICIDDDADCCLFTGANGAQLWLKREFVKAFGLHTVRGESADGKMCMGPVIVGTRDDWDIIIGAMRIDYQKGLQ